MSFRRRVLVVLVLFLLAVTVVALLGNRSQSRQALALYKAQLLAQGEKLTFADLATEWRPDLTNNSMSILTNAVALLRGVKRSPGELEIRRYTGPAQAQVSWRTNASGADFWPVFSAELAELQKPLADLREALKNPAADSGMRTNLWSAPRVDFVAIRTAAQWLAAATLCELRQGHPELALGNLESLIAMGRLNRDDYRVVAQMIRVALIGLGEAATWELLQAPGWTDPQLAGLQKEWESVDVLPGVEKAFVGERAVGQEVWKALRALKRSTQINARLGLSSNASAKNQTVSGMVADYLWLPAYKLTSINDDELFALRAAHESITAMRLLNLHHPWREARQGPDATMARVNQFVGTFQQFRYTYSLISIPNYSKAASIAAARETDRQMTIAAIALMRFRLRDGQFPAALEDLVPELLAKVPDDPMSGKALRYRMKPDGAFLLYSVGTDGVDDGGNPTSAATNRFDLWEGKDVVWPSATN